MAVASSDKVSERRADSNKFFLSVNSVIAGGILFINEKIEHIDNLSIVFVAIFGVVVCLVWLLTILDYKKLNSAKFELIHRMETDLPVQFYTDEWKVLNAGKHWYSKYKTFSKLELALPVAFILLYIGTAIAIIVS
jgi:hypothetical protein